MNEIKNIEIDKLSLSPLNPRLEQGDLKSLKETIENQGVLNPLVVRESKEGYEVCLGGRRFRAAKELELDEVPCRVRDLDDEEIVFSNLIDNEIRESLKPIELAESINYLQEEAGYSFNEMSKRLGMRVWRLKELMELFDAPQDIRREAGRKGLTVEHIKVMKENIRQPEEWDEWTEKVQEEGLSANTLEEMIQESWNEGDEDYVQEDLNRRPVFVTLTPEELMDAIEDKELVTSRQIFEGQKIIVTAKIKGVVEDYHRTEGNKYKVKFG